MRNRPILRLLGLALASGAALSGCFSERSAITETPPGQDLCASPTASTVQIRNFAFGGGEIRVSRGTRVTWVNCDTEAHTSTSDASGWDSGLLVPKATYSRTFDQAGRFAYHCEPHPFMKGTVVVE
ncbi:MAG TPA: cupredoxin family copper-binding protein [Longimicrobiaceae bacterium]|nr:cupredoxin family copper-binding protein [Longimicrobiaceae bacterium]